MTLQRVWSKSTILLLIDTSPSVMVSLSRGAPIIPSHHRHIILDLNERSDRLGQVSLSWFSLSNYIIKY